MNDSVAPGSIATTLPGMPHSRVERSQDRIARGASLVALSLVVLLVTCIKALACWYPVAFGDESTYSLLARYGATEEVVQRIGLIDQLPNHLYYAIYRLAFSFGDNFYTGAKLLNSAFIAASFFPIYLLCRLFLPVGKAVALAAITVLGPISSYATYFMAESPYFFGFWTYVYISIRSLGKPVIAQACISGVVLGLLVLIKPHAIMLLPCSALLFALVVWKKLDPSARWLQLPFAWIALVATFWVVRIATVYVLTGRLEFSPTGPVYGGFMADASNISTTMARLPSYFVELRGHIGVVTLTYFVPIVVLAIVIGRRFVASSTAKRFDPRLGALFGLGASIFALTVAMTIKHAVDIDETVSRLQVRYYSFALPLFPIGAAIVLDALSRQAPPELPYSRIAVVAAVVAAIAWLVSASLGHFEGSFGVVDFPDGYFLRQHGVRFLALLTAVVVIVLLLRNPRHGAAIFIVYWAVLMSVPTVEAQHWAINAVSETNEDRFPVAVKNLIGPDEKHSGLVVASTYADGKVFRVMFYLNSLSRVIIVPKGATLGEGRIDPDRTWLLLLDDYRVVVPSQTIAKGDGFELVRLIKNR